MYGTMHASRQGSRDSAHHGFPRATFSLRYACVIRPFPLSPINCVLTRDVQPSRASRRDGKKEKKKKKKRYAARPPYPRTYPRVLLLGAIAYRSRRLRYFFFFFFIILFLSPRVILARATTAISGNGQTKSTRVYIDIEGSRLSLCFEHGHVS